MTEQGFRSGTK